MNLPGVKTAVPAAIERLAEQHALPLPVSIDLVRDPVVVQLHTPDDVRAWALCLRSHVAQRTHVAGVGSSFTYALVHLVGVLVRLEAPGAGSPPRAAKGRTRSVEKGSPRPRRGESRKDTS